MSKKNAATATGSKRTKTIDIGHEVAHVDKYKSPVVRDGELVMISRVDITAIVDEYGVCNCSHDCDMHRVSQDKMSERCMALSTAGRRVIVGMPCPFFYRE